MGILKAKAGSGENMGQTDTGRRSFMWKAGAAVSAVLATAVPGMAKTRTGQGTDLKSQVDKLSLRLAILEDEKAIHCIHKTYENLLDRGMYKEVVKMFAKDGEVLFNGGIYRERDRGVSRLYNETFRQGLTGRKIESVPGFVMEEQESIEVAADRKSASASFPFSMQVGAPIQSDSQLVKMARLQGQGIIKWWEGGVVNVSYVKDENNGWNIKRLEYRSASRTDYRPGRSFSSAIEVPAFSKTYPEDPAGPDSLA